MYEGHRNVLVLFCLFLYLDIYFWNFDLLTRMPLAQRIFITRFHGVLKKFDQEAGAEGTVELSSHHTLLSLYCLQVERMSDRIAELQLNNHSSNKIHTWLPKVRKKSQAVGGGRQRATTASMY
ncbi:hypothetical protein ACJX0J_029732, partial [Zea mays]